MALSIVQAVTWEGVTSFPMQGIYGRDDFGRFVKGVDGFRYDLPDDAIVRRMAVADEEKPQEPAAAPAEKPPEPPPLSTDELTARRAGNQAMLAVIRKARDEALEQQGRVIASDVSPKRTRKSKKSAAPAAPAPPRRRR